MTVTRIDIREVFGWTRRCPKCGSKPTWSFSSSLGGVPYHVRINCPECSWVRVGPCKTLREARKEWNRLVKQYRKMGI